MNEIFSNALKSIKKKEINLPIVEFENPIKESYERIELLLKHLERMKKEVLHNDFRNHVEEIKFFKKIKPEITGKLLFYRKVIEIETLRPKGSVKNQKNFYEKQEKKILKSNFDNRNLEEYMESQREDKDKVYFIRKHTSFLDSQNDFFLKIMISLQPIVIYN